MGVNIDKTGLQGWKWEEMRDELGVEFAGLRMLSAQRLYWSYIQLLTNTRHICRYSIHVFIQYLFVEVMNKCLWNRQLINVQGDQ